MKVGTLEVRKGVVLQRAARKFVFGHAPVCMERQL
jgi:hypothetical protein